MAKQSGSVRTTISVPAELKRRMDKVPEDVNWSALACRAFEAKIVEITTKKEKQTMDDVIQRLRVSMQEGSSKSFNTGKEYGTEYAMRRAEAKELKRLDSWFDSFGGSFSQVEINAGHVHSAIDPESEQTYEEFWEWALNDWTQQEQAYVDDEDFVRGFVQGALDVWQEVKDQI